ncbi:Sterol regulatory element-binding protein cleavage-activating protein [Nymphon striatum]|nr:Sterol regulatory element-binding protein cleavage-activating protein [Nymphon striatum]
MNAIQEKDFIVEVNTTFEEFATVVSEDKKSATLDAGNVKLTYNSLLEKAEARERERQKEEARKLKKLESNFRNLMKNISPVIEYNSQWEDYRPNLEKESAFISIVTESERIRLFKEYTLQLEESCTHHHSKPKKSKKSKKQKKRSPSRSRSASSDSEDDDHRESRYHKSKKKKRSRSYSRSLSRDPSEEKRRYDSDRDEEEESLSKSKKHKKKKKKKQRSISPPVEYEKSRDYDKKSGDVEKKSSRKKVKSPSPNGEVMHQDNREKLKKSDGEASDFSEEELERQRRYLLEQLAGDHYPLLSYQLTGNAPLEYVIPLSHYHNHSNFLKSGNRSQAPRWFVGEPVNYVQQIILKSAVSPWKSNLIPSDAVRSPLSTVFSLFQADPDLMGTIYQNSAYSNDNFKEIIFGLPWSDTGLKRFYMRNRQRVITYAITIILKEYNPEFVQALKSHLLKTYKQNESRVQISDEIIQIHYEIQHHLIEFIPLAAAYLILFLYIYFSVRKYYLDIIINFEIPIPIGKIEHVKSKWALAVSALTTVIASLLISVSIFARFGPRFTLNGRYLFVLTIFVEITCSEIFPYLVVIIGLENMLVLTNSVVSTPGYLDVKIRVAQGLSKEGWSMTKNLITELCILVIGICTFVPAIQEFCIFAGVGIITDFLLQIFFFSTLLSIDIRGMELSDMHGYGYYQTQPLSSTNMEKRTPFFRCPISMSTKLFRSKSVPKLHSRAHSDILVGATQGSYTSTRILVPKRLKFIYFWARTRMVQKLFMAIMIFWISAVIYKFVLVYISPNNHQDSPNAFKFESLVSRKFENIQNNISSYNHVRSMISDSSHQSTYFRDNNYNWRQLSINHWPMLFELYNVSIYGRYISLLPPIRLSLSINPEDAMKQRHPKEVDISEKLKSLWSSDKPSSDNGEEVWYAANNTSFHEKKQLDTLLLAVISIPSIMLLVHIMIVLYRCICTRNYAEWRSSWHPAHFYGDQYSQTVHVETLPKTLRGHRQEVECIAVTGSQVVSSCLAGEIFVWDISTGECLTIIKRHTSISNAKTNESNVIEDHDISSDYESSSSPKSYTNAQHTLSKQLSSSPVFESHTCEELYSDLPDLSSTINTNFSVLPQKKFSFNEFNKLLNEHQIKSKEKDLNISDNVTKSAQNYKRHHVRSYSVGQNPSFSSPANFISSEPVISSSHIGSPSQIWCLDFENSLIVAGCADGNIEFWNSKNGFLLFINQQKASGVTSIKIVGNIVIAARLSGTVDFFILEKEELAEDQKFSSVAYNRGNKKMKSCIEQNKNDLILSEDILCNLYHSVHAHQQPINVLTVEGGRILTGSSDQTLKVLRVEDGCILLTLHGHRGAVTAVHVDNLAPTAAASGSDDGTVCMWDLMTGACIYQLNGHPNGSVLALLYTHTHVISTGTDNRICIWERQQGHLLHSLHLLQSYCNSIMMLTSNVLVTARQGSLVLWDINEGEAIRIVKLGNSDSSISVHQMKHTSTGVIVDYGQNLKVVPFPTMTEKVD